MADPGIARLVRERLLFGAPGVDGQPLDELCALRIGRAPRFGAVRAASPKSLRARAFVASFWHPAVFFSSPDGREAWYRDLPESPRTRAQLDSRLAHLIGLARWVPVAFSGGGSGLDSAFRDLCRPEHRPFWSPELPEVLPFDGEGNARAAAGGWRDVCVYVDPVGHRRIAHRLPQAVRP